MNIKSTYISIYIFNHFCHALSLDIFIPIFILRKIRTKIIFMDNFTQILILHHRIPFTITSEVSFRDVIGLFYGIS